MPATVFPLWERAMPATVFPLWERAMPATFFPLWERAMPATRCLPMGPTSPGIDAHITLPDRRCKRIAAHPRNNPRLERADVVFLRHQHARAVRA